MRILEFSDSHLRGTKCSNTETLIDVATQEKPDLLIGNGDVDEPILSKREDGFLFFDRKCFAPIQ